MNPKHADHRRDSAPARRNSFLAYRILIQGVALSVLFVLVTGGCSKTDLSGYRTVNQSEEAQSAAKGQNVSDNDSAGALPSDLHQPETGIKKSDPISHEDSNGLDADQKLPESTETLDSTSLPVSALVPVNVLDGASVRSLLKVAPEEKKTVAATESPDAKSTTGTTGVMPEKAEPRKVEVLIPEKSFRTDNSSKALRVSYDDLDLLKVINMEPVTIDAVDVMPAWLKRLSGQRIKIRGFMFPTFEAEGLERFVLARDNQICCFGRDPKVYDLVEVSMKAGKTTNYIPATRSFDVVGRLKIQMVESDGKPFGLYFLEDAEVIDR